MVAVILPILFIFFASIVISKLLLRKKEMRNLFKVQPQHAETNQLVEVDYAKITVERQQPQLQAVQNFNNNLPPLMARPSIYV